MDVHKEKLSRMERKRKETRQKIVATTIQLIQANGFDATTMEQIAKETDIAKGTLYNYYSVKEAIISDYIKQTFEKKNNNRIMRIETLTDLRSRMVFIISNLMEGVKRHTEIFEKYLVYQMKQMVSFDKNEDDGSGIATPICEIIKLGQQEGEIRCDLPFLTLYDFFLFTFIQVVKQYYNDPQEFDKNDSVGKNIELFINGVKPMLKKLGEE